jgi:predicted TIM-barrel fold metal-dependent hydrolase
MASIIDADGHIVEPRSFWDDYVEAKYRDRLPRITKDSNGIDRIAFGGRISTNSIYPPAAMCVPGGMATPELMRNMTWDDLRPGSYDSHARLADMDAEGIDVSVLFPSIGIGFVGIKDPEVSAAGCRAYNNWMADFCRVAPDRLYSVAPVPLVDVDLAIPEMRRIVKSQGVKAVLVRSNPYNNRRLSDPAYDPFWAEAQELDCTIALHAAVTGDMPTAGFDRYHDFFQRNHFSSAGTADGLYGHHLRRCARQISALAGQLSRSRGRMDSILAGPNGRVLRKNRSSGAQG